MQILPISSKPLLTLPEAGNLSGISAWTLRHDILTGKLACYRRGGPRGKILIAPADLEAYLQRHRQAAVDETETAKNSPIRQEARE